VPCCHQLTTRFYGSTAQVVLGLLREPPRSRKINNTTLGRSPLDEWSARRSDIWQYTILTGNRRTCTRRDSNPQLQRAATGIGHPTILAFLRWSFLGWTLPACDSHDNIATLFDKLTADLATTNSDQVALQIADKQRWLARCAYESHVVCTDWQIEVAGSRRVFDKRAEEEGRK